MSEFGISLELLRLINLCLTETYSGVGVGKHSSDINPIVACFLLGNSSASELPRRKHKTFRTRQKFEIKNVSY
jgi:hypothetical protein